MSCYKTNEKLQSNVMQIKLGFTSYFLKTKIKNAEKYYFDLKKKLLHPLAFYPQACLPCELKEEGGQIDLET